MKWIVILFVGLALYLTTVPLQMFGDGSITMSINGASFHAEGDAEEVGAKFKAWLDETLAPIKAVKELAEKTLRQP